MKVSQLIAQLKAFEAEHGDCPITIGTHHGERHHVKGVREEKGFCGQKIAAIEPSE
jgi:hypothetical protein